MSAGKLGLSRFLVVPLSLALIALAVGAPLVAAKGGNSLNAKSCQKGGWMNLQRSDGTLFTSEQACTSYGAKGGTLMPRTTTISIGNGGADGEVGGGFVSSIGGPWTTLFGCATGYFAHNTDDEGRFALEFPLSVLPAGATITSASLALRTSRSDLAGQTAIYGYAGDGTISAADVTVTGTPVLFTATTDSSRESHVVTGLLTAGVIQSGWAGFSLRQEPLGPDGTFWDCPNSFRYPILTIQYTTA